MYMFVKTILNLTIHCQKVHLPCQVWTHIVLSAGPYDLFWKLVYTKDGGSNSHAINDSIKVKASQYSLFNKIKVLKNGDTSVVE